MNFHFAHRRSAWASRALRLCSALSAAVIACPGFAACGQPAGRVQAESVDERLDVALADGRLVRLGGLDTPNANRGAPEIAQTAHDFLGKRLVGRQADLVARRRD
jgi:hypothetical protein